MRSLLLFVLWSGWSLAGLAAPLELIPSGAITVDGKLDEPLYREGTWQRSFQTLATAQPANPDTAFRLLSDGNTLYFSAKADEPGGKVMAEERERDGAVWKDDVLELFLQTGDDRSEFFQILVNARGVVTDIRYGQGGHTKERQWNTTARAATQIGPEGWTVELAIPLAELAIDPALEQWGVQVARERVPRGEGSQRITMWPASADALARPDSFGVLKLPSFDRQLLGWKLMPGPARVVRREGGYFLRQSIKVLNRTGKYRNLMLHSFLPDGEKTRGKKMFGLADGKSADVETEIALGDQPGFAGTLRHEVTLANAPERMLAFASTEVDADYLPAELKLLAPGYRASIFASQNLKTIEAELHQVDESLSLSDLRAVLQGQDGKERNAVVTSLAPHRWGIAVPQADTLAEGSYTLVVEFKTDGRPLRLERTITRLPFRAGEVWIDRNGFLFREGKPFPVYGFCFGNWMQMDENRFPGMALTLAAPVWAVAPFKSMVKEIEHLAQHGVYSAVYIAAGSKTGYTPMGKVPLTAQERDEYRSVARAARDHPFVLAYYLFDEPEANGMHPVRLQEIYQLIREEDPHRPVILLNNSLEGVRDYQACADILAPDPYPLFLEGGSSSRPMERVGLFLDEIVTGKESFRARWLTPQGFNYGNYNAEGNRGPTAREMRLQQIIGLIHGVSGISWYTEYLIWDEPGAFASLPYLSQEFHALFPLLVRQPVERLDAGEGWAAALSHRDEESILLVANLLYHEREVTIRDPRLAGVEQWSRLGSAEKIPGAKGEITLRLQPYEGVILVAQGVPVPEDLQWTKVEEMEAAAWKASLVPGNIAHRSQGTKVTGVGTSRSLHLRPTMVNDGMKDPRGAGFEQSAFQSGMGVELNFGSPRRPARLLVIGSNIEKARVEQEGADGSWEEIATLTGGEEFILETSLPARETQRLRLMIESLQVGKSKLQIREIEIYEN